MENHVKLKNRVTAHKLGYTGKEPDATKDWRLEKEETTEDEMVGWHHQHNGHEFE